MRAMALAACVMLLVGCASGSAQESAQVTARRKTTLDYFGTVSTVLVYDDFTEPDAVQRFENTWTQIEAVFAEVEAALSVDIPDSDVARFNRLGAGESVEVGPITAAVFSMAAQAYELTDGCYNPAVSRLVDLWGFSPRFSEDGGEAQPYDRPREDGGGFALPDLAYQEAFRDQAAGFEQIVLSGDETTGYRLTKGVPDAVVEGQTYPVQIDLGGIGKGYCADLVAEVLRECGYEYGLVSIGSSSMQLLKRYEASEGAPLPNQWAVHVADPRNRSETYLTLYGADQGLSTSGTYEHCYWVDGREYSHIIDPATGEPTESEIVSVTLLGGDAAMSDALTTAMVVMGEQGATAFMQQYLDGYSVAVVVQDGDTLRTVTNLEHGQYRE